MAAAYFIWGAGQAKRTASPLTPALSPLRGEGDTHSDVLEELNVIVLSDSRQFSLSPPRGEGRGEG